MNRFKGILYHWLTLAVAIIGITGLIYVAIQQNYRQSLNDPQVQLAQDIANGLMSGKGPAEVVPQDYLFDAGKSLATFMAVYDASGKPLQATAFINNAPPKPPVGVFEYARKAGEHRVTWQPNANTRIALVIRYVPGDQEYFAVAGRNMREVESRIHKTGLTLGLGLIVVLIASFLLEVFGDTLRRRMMAAEKK
jgi:hypothetical protein